MTLSTRILIATEAEADAELVKKLLSEEFDDIAISTKHELAIEDFDRERPAVLVLAFDTLDEAERYYLGLYRISTVMRTLPHYTVILCNRSDLAEVYEMCRDQHYDDYVLFWPATSDAPRLRMAVHHALRERHLAGPDAVLGQQMRKSQRFEALAATYDFPTPPPVPSAEAARSAAAQPTAIDAARAAALPAQIAAAALQDEHRTASAAAPLSDATHAHGLPRAQVLVVDDDSFQHTLLKKLLAATNVDLSFASSGAEAIAMLATLTPHLILMDVDMPEVTGIETTRRLKANPAFAKIPVIMITGHSDRSVVVASLQAGAIDFIVKPFDRIALQAKIASFLG
jgi:CheY-like chemotaxis protein